MQGFPWAERGDPIHSVPVMVKMGENVETGPMDQHGMVIGDKAQLEVIQVKWFQ